MNICTTVTDDVPMVAVVGMAGRFPQASGIAEFWDNLCAGRECLKRFTAAELRAVGVPEALCADERYVPVNGVLADVELFDAAFFGMTPRDASITDPQQRIFLELAWDALEHAGYDPGRYPGRIGVYAGCGPSSYFLHNLLPNRAALADIAELRLQMGNNPSYLATRLSYQLNLTGPSLTIGTACSTSLVAIHMACDALRDHQCDIALAGGISVQFPQVRGYLYETDSILSPDGHCRAFDARAQGTVSGNGGAVVVLKRLADALKENDAIYAVIRGSAVNNDGAEKSGYTAPSVRGQMRAIYEAQAVAGVPADTIGYVETHGTATQLGDPIEFEALTRAFRQQTTRNQFCAIGSVKTNVGHLDEGAGVTGFIKTVLCLQHRQIPPSLHFQVPNPELAYATSPFRVADALMDFPAPGPGVPRRAAVSSFGIGGTNAHVVLEEPPPVEAAAPSRAVQLLLLSARTAGELEEMTSRLARHLQAKPDICVADVAYTLQVGRKEFPYRRMALCRSREEAVSALEARTPQRVVTALASSSARPIVFLFPGQGSQHVDMGAGLYESERCFRDAVDRCADFLRPQLGLDLRSAMFSRDGQAAEAQLERTELAQPALFIIAYALAQQLSSFGIRPRAMIGHSIGEYVAACLAGVFALEDALTLVAERGRLMQSMPPGGMLAVELAERELLPLLGENLTLAAVNAPSLCVVAGPITAIRTMQEQLSGRGIACRRLHTSHAFHSRFMDPILEPFLQRVHAATRNPPAIPFVSNVTGSWIAAEQATDPQYWASHLRHTVRFSEGVRQLMREGDNVFLEVGPGQGLAGLVRRHFDRGAEPVIMSALRHAGDPRDDSAQLLETVGRLWLAGACRKPELRDAQEKRRRIPLPTYPFERRRFWIDPAVPGEADDHTASPPKTGGNATVDGWFFAPVWRRRVDPFTPVRTVVDGACWLVFADGCGLGDSLAEQLRMGGCRVFTVSAGSAFARRGDDYFVLDASKPEHYDRLIGELARSRHEPRNIVHLWTVDANGAAGDWDTVQSLGFFSLMFLVQAAGRQGWTEKLALHVVSSRMQRVFDDEVSRPEKATILGPVRVVPKEFPGIRCRSIDVVQPSSGRWHDTGCLDRLVAELLSENFASATAIRDGQVWEQAFAPVELREPGGVPARLRAGGTYLITGGLGSMGLAFARCLARDARARMILLGRTGLPPEAEWDGLLRRSAPDGDETVRGRTAAPCVIAFDPVKASDLVQSLEQRAQAGAPLLDIDGDARLQMLLHAFCSGLIGRYLRDGGIALQDGGCLSREEMRERLHIQPPFARLFSFLLGCLGEDGIISIDGDRIEVCRNLTAEALAETRQAILVEYPKFRGLVDLLEHCTARYRQALSGEIPSISVLYPDGTSTLMDARRRDTPEYTRDGLYLALTAQVLAHLASRPGGTKLRILEVGGGSGGLTRAVLAALRGHAVDYCFTDVSRSFVRRAETEAAAQGITGIRFGVLDIARDPEPQGYPPRGFDVVCGYNVVHATPRMEESVASLRRLLAPGGLMMLVETTRLRRWDEMVWGLAEGWWHFADTDLRTDSPLISLDAWEELLRRQGFAAVAAYPRAAAARRASDVGLIMARAAVDKSDASPPTAAEHARTLAAIEAVRAIRRLGGDIMVIRADVADEDQVRTALSAAEARFGAPHGIIHTAGILGQGLIQAKTPEQARAVFGAKANGILTLEKILRQRGMEPDFIVVCSSLASLAPIAGQIDYCAANAFLDAYAASRVGRKPAIVSVDWGFWQELGMIEQAEASPQWKQQIADEIREKGWSEAGVQAFRRILDSGEPPQVLVSPNRLDALVPIEDSSPARSLALADERPPRRSLRHPLLDECLLETAELRAYASFLNAGHWVLDEHRPFGEAVLPGTAFLELARAALDVEAACRPIQISDVYFLVPLVFKDGETKEIRTILSKRDDGFAFVVISRVEADADEWHEHARGDIAFLTAEPPSGRDLDDVERCCRRADINVAQDTSVIFERFRGFAPHWRTMERLRVGAGEGLATLRLADAFAPETDALPLHPALADVATGFMSVVEGFEQGVPFGYRRLRLWRPLSARVHSHVRSVENSQPEERSYDATIMDQHGNVLVDVAGFTLRRFRSEVAQDPRQQPEDQWNFCVEIERPGSIATLGLRSDVRRSPGPGEAEIEVGAAGLNFIEVLYALGMLPEPPGGNVRFGLECAGRIVALGAGVTRFRIGDAVFGFVPQAFSRFAVTAATSIALKPEPLSLAEAATFPAAYTTAYYALVTRGGLQRGERVLIHAASGGVGLAAVNIATWRGAEIYATAGTAEKRAHLRSLGIRHVFDSRSLDFAAQVLDATAGRGVDVVLNSLGGAFIPASLSTLARHGRFLELGKRDILRNTSLGLAPFAKHLSFTAIDVGTDLPDFQRVWREVVRRVQDGSFRPLPFREFPVARVAEAFDHMAQSRHIGKLVISLAGVDAAMVGRRRRRGRPLQDIIGSAAALLADTGVAGVVAKDWEPDSQPARLSLSHARPALATPYRAPSDETERKIVEIWEELLGISGIGVDDNFLDLRGDSLLAAQVTSRLYRTFSVKLPLSSVFDQPTAAALAARVEQMRQSARQLATTPTSRLAEREVEHEL